MLPRYLPAGPQLGAKARDSWAVPKVVKYIGAVPPDVDRAVLPNTLIIEAIHLQASMTVTLCWHAAQSGSTCLLLCPSGTRNQPSRSTTEAHLCDLAALVVATYERYSVWVPHLSSQLCASVPGLAEPEVAAQEHPEVANRHGYAHGVSEQPDTQHGAKILTILELLKACLECKEKQKGLYAIETPIHKVAHEEVVGLRAVSAMLEELQQVVKLAVDVATCAF